MSAHVRDYLRKHDPSEPLPFLHAYSVVLRFVEVFKYEKIKNKNFRHLRQVTKKFSATVGIFITLIYFMGRYGKSFILARCWKFSVGVMSTP